MFTQISSAGIRGMEGFLVSVEADVSNGLPGFSISGQLALEVREAQERVRTALKNSDFQLPAKKITVNLSPAGRRKEGTVFDLPIAAAVLGAFELLSAEKLKDALLIGELGLDGSVKPVRGVLVLVSAAKKMGFRRCLLPVANVSEGTLVEGIQIIGIQSLRHLQEVLSQDNWEDMDLEISGNINRRTFKPEYLFDFKEICGQSVLRRAAEVAVAGRHGLLMCGSAGTGKSMVAKRIPTILPPMQLEESMEVTKIYSVAGMVDREHPLITKRPFRSVHHTVTRAALIGGGVIPNPGEISLAHGGVLFLDELAEFRKPVLEVLRQPLEEHKIRISRNSGCYEYPADFMLIAAMNPCPCGNYPDLNKCNCTKTQIQNYLGHVSQPFLDRMDLCVEASRVEYGELHKTGKEETSAEIRNRVCTARKIQEQRYEGTDIRTNSGIGVRQMEEFCQIGEKEEKLMRCAFSTMNLTARTYHKVLKVARTIADLDGEEQIGCSHLKEALGYRMLDKKYWGR